MSELAATPGRVLVTGWFSMDDGETTAGDMLACQTVEGWLAGAGVPHDVAMADGLRTDGQVALEELDPGRYSDVLFVCGPVASEKVERMLRPFAGCRRIAVGVSVTSGLDGRFDAALPRDGDGAPVPDLSLGRDRRATPVVGIILAHPQPEYGERQRHAQAERVVRDLLRRSPVTPVRVDTRLDAVDELACATAEGLQSVLARLDAVVTTRLHGLVLALRAGVPALAVDPVAGGAKVSGQAVALRWPAVVAVEDAGAAELDDMLRWCLTDEARALAATCASRGRTGLERTRDALLALLGITERAVERLGPSDRD